MKKITFQIFFIILSFIPSQTFSWDDICQIAKETPYMTSAQLSKHYDDNVRGRFVTGRGIVRNVWEYGINGNNAVAVDCGNDVIVNVATNWRNLYDLKAGQRVDFDGKVISYDRRRYVDTKTVYTIYELENGSIRY